MTARMVHSEFRGGNTLPSQLLELLENQKKDWPQLRNNYLALEGLQGRELLSADGYLKTQFNPARIISTAADTEVRDRKCFLCVENLPPAQKGVLYREDFLVLCNPFPIFPGHFTIPSLAHKPQGIGESLDAFLLLADDLGLGFAVFYNGPRCGASAPDHLHFQACPSGLLPVQRIAISQKPDFIINNAEVHVLENGGRGIAAVKSAGREDMKEAMKSLIASLGKASPTPVEPLLNLIAWREEPGFRLMLFPRRKFRPECFYDEGEGKVIVSPAAVEMGGLLVLPVERDFQAMDYARASSILREVTFDRAAILAMLAGYSTSQT